MTRHHRVTAVYPGTFDPMTLGHEDLMRRASTLFDALIVAVAAGHHKRTLFSLEERLEIAREAAQAHPNVEVMPFSGLLRDFVVGQQGKVVVRGLRAVSDFEYEFQIALMNRHLYPDLETVFMTPSLDTTYISSSMVREVAKFGGDVSGLVHPVVGEALVARYRAQGFGRSAEALAPVGTSGAGHG